MWTPVVGTKRQTPLINSACPPYCLCYLPTLFCVVEEHDGLRFAGVRECYIVVPLANVAAASEACGKRVHAPALLAHAASTPRARLSCSLIKEMRSVLNPSPPSSSRAAVMSAAVGLPSTTSMAQSVLPNQPGNW